MRQSILSKFGRDHKTIIHQGNDHNPTESHLLVSTLHLGFKMIDHVKSRLQWYRRLQQQRPSGYKEVLISQTNTASYHVRDQVQTWLRQAPPPCTLAVSTVYPVQPSSMVIRASSPPLTNKKPVRDTELPFRTDKAKAATAGRSQMDKDDNDSSRQISSQATSTTIYWNWRHHCNWQHHMVLGVNETGTSGVDPLP